MTSRIDIIGQNGPTGEHYKMRTIYKYDVYGKVLTGPSSRILSVKIQYGTLCVWIEHDMEEELKPIQLVVVGTGHTFEAGMQYVDTVIDGQFVWHIYK